MKTYYYLLLIILFSISQESFSQGLKFRSSKEQPIDKRTSYNVFGDKSVMFSGYYNIEFDLSLYQATPIGYILRIKNQKNDKIYNLFYDGQGDNIQFKFNEEGKSSLITAKINKAELINLPWFKTIISFDLVNNSIKLTIHNRTFVANNAGLPEKYYPIIIFGKSDYLIDVPSFAIQNVSVGNNDKKYTFVLKENRGNIVHDSNGRETGDVINPEWLINDSYQWKFKTLFKSKTVAGANYNPEKKEIYYFNKDSIYIYNVRSGEIKTEVFKKNCPVMLTLGTNFIDPKLHKLYAYEVYFDESSKYKGPSVASLNLDTYQWTTESSDKLPTQLHHHGSYFDTDNHRYILFGGFGNMHYNKIFYTFDTESKAWDTLRVKGDATIHPRYFVSMGYQKKNNSLYVFGGMGNKSGEQVVGRKYFYDLYKVDLNTKNVTKLWKIEWNNENVVPVRGMVIQDSCFYTLCYPEHYSNSFLRLYRFSLKDGSYKILGDSIPIHSDKITTNANLYFDNQLNTLFATVQEFDDDIRSVLKVYSLSFPPITAEELSGYLPVKTTNIYRWLAVLSSLILIAIIFIWRQSRRRNRNQESEEITTEPVTIKKQHITDIPNSIYLFGEFTVYNRQKRDISYMFSSKIKQVFLLILQYSKEEGITSQKLSHLLWPDISEAKVKNSRGVTINNLRKILKELDGIELIYDKGLYKIELSGNCYCDYERCLHIISSNLTEKNKEELLQILYRGKFLQSYDLSLFDQFKGTLEQELEPLLVTEMKKGYNNNDYPSTLSFAEAMLIIDPINDEALAYQVKSLQKMKQNYEAQRHYLDFVNHYKKTMGVDYPHSFNDLRI
ncbi:MAG: DNA-binding transcriptional activator [Bacteroidota bacterium]|nr:DNA-binding transcriptional activator [Bacteroidota bacterium]